MIPLFLIKGTWWPACTNIPGSKRGNKFSTCGKTTDLVSWQRRLRRQFLCYLSKTPTSDWDLPHGILAAPSHSSGPCNSNHPLYAFCLIRGISWGMLARTFRARLQPRKGRKVPSGLLQPIPRGVHVDSKTCILFIALLRQTLYYSLWIYSLKGITFYASDSV